MSQVLKPYPEYKDSGLTWLGKIPVHWTEKRAKYFFREVDERSSTGQEEMLSVSHITGVTPRSQKNVTMFTAESNAGHKLCHPGDLVINTMWAWMAALGVAKQTGIVSPSYAVYRPIRANAFVPEYIDHLLRTKPYATEYLCRSTGIRSSRLRLYPEKLLEIPISCPPCQEQTQMLAFLNAKDLLIRRYISSKRRLIKLLNEWKQAIINRAVTRGLDPNVRLKPSGVEWLGDMPEHWEVRQVKQISRILRGKFSHRPRNDPSLYEGPYPFIQTGDVARAEKSITHYRQTLNERGLAVSKMFPAGTLVMTIAANIGDVAVLDFEACFPDSVVGFVPRGSLDRDYLYYVFRAMKPELLREAPVNTQGNLNIDRIGSRGIALPPAPEQPVIVKQIEKSTRGLDAAIIHARGGIELLNEYRTRLISDVVTGKLDVRAAKLPAVEEIEIPEEWNGTLDAESDLLEDQELPELTQEAGD